MAQNDHELSSEIKEFIVSPSSYEIRMPVLDRTLTCDVSGDFVLPDYLPEIKRLLRVTPTVSESSKYVGQGSVEFAGAVNYTVLYADGDGRLFCAPLSSDYDFECKTGGTDGELSSDAVFCDTGIESVNCRPVGPRKLVMKSRLCSRVRAFENTAIPERTEGNVTPEDEYSIERLKRVYPTACLVRGKGDEISVDGEIEPGGVSGSVKPVFCEGKVAVLDVSCGEDGAQVRAELAVRCLLEKEDGELFCVSKRFPVSDNVELRGAGRDAGCMAWGRCETVSVNAEHSEDEHRTRLFCEATVIFEAEAVKNLPASVTEDAFSTQYECECGVKEYEFPYSQKVICTTFNFANSLPLAEVGVDSGGNVIDLCGEAKIEKVENANGKLTASGVCRASALISGEEIQSTEFDLPFKYEFDGGAGEVADFDAEASVVSIRARAEGENVAFDGEIALALSVFGKNTAAVAEKVTLDKSRPVKDDVKGPAFMIFYPDKSDSLWSVAKKYRVPLSKLSEKNEPLPGDAASTASLAGRDFIIFDK